MDIKHKFAQRMRLLRNEAGISQEELAFKSKLDRTYINSVENGKRNISIVNIEKIAKALGISVSEFFNNTDLN